MAIRFKSSFTAKKHIDSIKQRNKTNMGQALSDAKAEMLIDISGGVGYDQKKMPEYSKAYKKYKQRKLGNTTVNLTETGKMLKAMQVSVLETSQKLIGRIYFLAGERDKARWNAADRNFFGLSNSNLTRLKKTLGIK